MARDEKKLKEMFLSDARKTADLLRAGRVRLRGGKAGGDELDAVFRAVHSIKSEAGFLGLRDLAGAASQVEEALGRARGAAGGFEAPGFIGSIGRLESLLAGLVKENGIPAVARIGDDPGLSDFEKNQLREAVLRGERLFKVSCSVDRQNPMPYARLYLVVNNLELSANVIRMIPPLEELSEGKTHALELTVSSSLSEDELRRLLAVDELERLVIEPKNIRDFFPEEAVEEDGAAGQTPYRSLAIEYPSSVSISRTAAQEALLLAELGRSAGSEEALRTLLEGQARIWSEVAGVSTAWLVQKLEGVMGDLNGRSGKAVRLSCSGELKARLPFETFGGLADALVQLVRNAHDHGIESAEERRRAGKRQPGQIGVHFAVHGGRWRITVRDDGRGIDRTAVLEKARRAGRKPAEDADLLELIAAPGFSMAAGGSAVSGRGVGLDIARYAALTILGGSMTLETAPGAGAAFHLEFDPAASRCRVIPILVGSIRLPIPDFMMREYTAWSVDKLKEEKGGLCYGVREMLVPIHPDYVADIPAARFAAIIQRRGEVIAIPAVEILKETYLSRDEIIDSPLRSFLVS